MQERTGSNVRITAEDPLSTLAASGTWGAPLEGLTLDAGTLRRLLTGQDESRRMAPGVLALRNCSISGTLNLSSCQLEHTIDCEDCNFEHGIVVDDAQLQSLTLKRCTIGRFSGDRLRVRGQLDATESRFAQGLELRGANIGDCLNLSGIRAAAPPGGHEAIAAEGITIGRNVYVSRGCKIDGNVNFWGARITGDAVFNGGTFNGLASVSIGLPPVAIELHSARVDGTLWLGAAETAPDNRPAVINGLLDLRSAGAGQFHDDMQSWPKTGNLVLDGFKYKRLYGRSPTTAAERARWIDLQPEVYRRRPQPYDQLAFVLKEMGLENEAHRVAMRRQGRSLKWQLAENWLRAPWLCIKWLFLGLLMGFGYRPHRLAALAVAVWALCAAVYFQASEQGIFTPSDPEIYLHQRYSDCGRPPNTWSKCGPAELPEFNALHYSLDVLAAPLDLDLERRWMPSRRSMVLALPGLGPIRLGPNTVTNLVLFERVFGWTFFILIGAHLVGLLRRSPTGG